MYYILLFLALAVVVTVIATLLVRRRRGPGLGLDAGPAVRDAIAPDVGRQIFAGMAGLQPTPAQNPLAEPARDPGTTGGRRIGVKQWGDKPDAAQIQAVYGDRFRDELETRRPRADTSIDTPAAETETVLLPEPDKL